MSALLFKDIHAGCVFIQGLRSTVSLLCKDSILSKSTYMKFLVKKLNYALLP